MNSTCEWWDDTYRLKPQILGENPVPVPLWPTKIPTCAGVGSKSAVRGERPATNRLSHGAAWRSIPSVK